eukprot:jgi/Hompol1/476/HPOL_004517-RA
MQNVVIDGSFHAKIIDFGSAAIEHPDPSIRFNKFQGTIQYASPEILRGEKYKGKPSDIWALGILLYTILFGEIPFPSSEHALNANFKRPRCMPSPECLDLITGMLNKAAQRRPSADQVLAHPWLTNGLESQVAPDARESFQIP